MENHSKMDDLGVPLFLETPIYYSHSSCETSMASTMDFPLISKRHASLHRLFWWKFLIQNLAWESYKILRNLQQDLLNGPLNLSI